MEVLFDGLVGGQKYFVVTGMGYAPVHFIQRKQAQFAPGLPVEEQPPSMLQVAVLNKKDEPVNTMLLHAGEVKFFDDEQSACMLATGLAYTLFMNLRGRLEELNNTKQIIVPGGKIGPAPARMIIKP